MKMVRIHCEGQTMDLTFQSAIELLEFLETNIIPHADDEELRGTMMKLHWDDEILKLEHSKVRGFTMLLRQQLSALGVIGNA